MQPLFANLMSPTTLIVLLGLGVLFFGRRLPEIGRYLGKGLVEFKKGLHGLEDDFDIMGRNTPSSQQEPVAREQIRPPQRVQATAPKFEDNIPNIPTPPRA
jgi:sec-independent protein translocase protein TatA